MFPQPDVSLRCFFWFFQSKKYTKLVSEYILHEYLQNSATSTVFPVTECKMLQAGHFSVPYYVKTQIPCFRQVNSAIDIDLDKKKRILFYTFIEIETHKISPSLFTSVFLTKTTEQLSNTWRYLEHPMRFPACESTRRNSTHLWRSDAHIPGLGRQCRGGAP